MTLAPPPESAAIDCRAAAGPLAHVVWRLAGTPGNRLSLRVRRVVLGGIERARLSSTFSLARTLVHVRGARALVEGTLPDYLGLVDRGRLADGAHADVVVLDGDLRLQRVIAEGEKIDLADA